MLRHSSLFTRCLTLAFTAATFIATVAFAQSAAPAPTANTPLPPPLLLGDRVLRSYEKLQIVPVLVVVRDPASYLAAISAWTPIRRYPVLIDDGSSASAEDIGRFARAFAPEKVVSWSEPGSDAQTAFAGVEIARMKAAVAGAWGVDKSASDQEFILALRQQRQTPPGIVIVQSGDQAWTAGVAVAAFRGLPIADAAISPGIDRIASTQEAEDFCTKIEAAAEATGLSWRGLGDNLDAVLLASNAPAKFVKQGNESLALTDRVGRLGRGVEVPERWAWCGQIFGDARAACYRAMCGLFLTHTGAWLFDGYPDTKPWNMYDCTAAAAALKESGIKCETFDTPNQSSAAWRSRAAKPVDADLVLINSKGNADFFDVEPGQCKPGDVPILTKPIAMHIVHSWSAFVPGSRDLLAGRWLERGAYFYVGSVHEPYLQAFLPTPNLASRMTSGAAWGAAVRLDGGPCWKVAVFGDPLIVFKRGWQRAEAVVPVSDATDIGEELRALLRERNFESALRLLVISGRDADASKIAAAVARDEPTLFSSALAEWAVLPHFRAGKFDDMLVAYDKLDALSAGRPDLRDALWLAGSQALLRSPPAKLLDLLRRNIRKDQVARDALNLAAAWPAGRTPSSPTALLDEILSETQDKAQRDALREAMKQPVTAWSK